jgi:hypothetical protein
MIEGTCGESCSFVVHVVEAQTKHGSDTMNVKVVGGCEGTGDDQPVTNGNIQIHH